MYITLDRQVKYGPPRGSQHALDTRRCTARRARFETLLTEEERANVHEVGAAAAEAQASSSCSCQAIVQDAGSTALDEPVDAGSTAPLARQDEVSAVEGTSCSADVTGPMQGVTVVADKWRQATAHSFRASTLTWTRTGVCDMA